MSDKVLREFKKTHDISKAICWNSNSRQFCGRAYSATVTAQKTNDAFIKFKSNLDHGVSNAPQKPDKN